MKPIIILTFLSFLSSGSTECKKIFEKGSCLVIRTYPNCVDTLIYSDSCFRNGKISNVVIINERTKSRESSYFNDQGIPNEYRKTIITDNTTSYYSMNKNGKIYLELDHSKINDSLYEEVNYYENGKIGSKGKTINSMRFGNWVEYDSLHKFKDSGSYLPIYSYDTSYVADEEEPEFRLVKVVGFNGTKTGKWVKYDSNGNIVQEHFYK